MIVDGRQLATDILREVREQVSRTIVVRAIVIAPSPATESYLSIKSARAEEAGMHLEVIRLDAHADPDEIKEWITSAGCDAVIVQLPLPHHFDTRALLDAIPVARDADVLSSSAYEAFAKNTPGALMPPVVCAAKEILSRAGINPAGKRAVVVGQGRLVGEPAAAWLRNAGAEVSVITREAGDLATLKDAEIIISGAGSPALIKPEHLTPGVALIDAGTSESDGALVGDADPACLTVAGVFTPVPGGVGPLAVACLFRNVAALVASPLQQG